MAPVGAGFVGEFVPDVPAFEEDVFEDAVAVCHVEAEAFAAAPGGGVFNAGEGVAVGPDEGAVFVPGAGAAAVVAAAVIGGEAEADAAAAHGDVGAAAEVHGGGEEGHFLADEGHGGFVPAVEVDVGVAEDVFDGLHGCADAVGEVYH